MYKFDQVSKFHKTWSTLCVKSSPYERVVLVGYTQKFDTYTNSVYRLTRVQAAN